MAVILMNFMYRLGCGKFIVHGSGSGGVLAGYLTTLYPGNVLVHHSAMCLTHSWKSVAKWVVASVWPSVFIPAEFQSFSFPIGDKLVRLYEDSAHVHMLLTQTHKIHAMTVTQPAALAAFVLGECERLTPGIDKEALIDNVMIYYLNGNLGTAARVFAGEASSGFCACQRTPFICRRLSYDRLAIDGQVYEIDS